MLQTDIGAYLKCYESGVSRALAGGAGDNPEVDGTVVDRQGYSSCKLVIAWEATLDATETLSLAYTLQEGDASDLSDAADFGTVVASAVVGTGGTGGTTEAGVVEADYNLVANPCGRYIRAQYTPDLSRAGTDIATVAAVIILGGADTLPAA